MTVPSEIVQMIRERYPNLADNTNLASQPEVTFIAGILDAVEHIPSDLIPSGLGTRLRAVVGSLQRSVRSCEGDVRRGHLSGRDVGGVLAILEQLPDEPFQPDETALRFIDDEDLRRILSVDIASAHRALSNGEWKSATVLAGSVIEALCLWAIRRTGDDAQALRVAGELRTAGTITTNVPGDLLKWHAHELIEVAFALRLIPEDAVGVARTTKNYRNLIHPGRELRTGERCTRGTSHVAVGAMERVVESLRGRDAA